jgi:hypothetical protein
LEMIKFFQKRTKTKDEETKRWLGQLFNNFVSTKLFASKINRDSEK